MKLFLGAAFLCMFFFKTYAQNNNYFPVRTTIANGIIEGNYDVKSGISQYFGIPFAKPPVGDLRWKAPQPVDNWKGVKETRQFAPRPIQGVVFGDMQSRSDGLSEDCLYLNVWTPGAKNEKKLPVLVYFYGGGFVAGDASEPRYDGEAMAKEGIVAVTVNYRLGLFGFFSHPELSAESPYKGSGNYGLLDQTAALQWVKKNIAAFGGDPEHVTIAGESAGSISVSYQMASPLAKGLIDAAIGESGAGIEPTLPPMSLKEAEQIGLEFAKKAGYPTLSELRKLSTAQLFEMYQASKRFGFPVTVDNYFLPETLPQIFESKKQSDIPLLVGWNSAEIPGGAFMMGQPYTTEAFMARLKATYPSDYDAFAKAYKASDDKEAEWAATDLASDRFIVYSTWKWFDLQRQFGTKPVYRYLFSQVRPPLRDQDLAPGLAGGTMKSNGAQPKPPQPIGAPHASEIEYCMGNLPLVNDYDWTAADYQASKTMFNYFANFIKTYDPNGQGLPEWKSATRTETAAPVMVISDSSQLKTALHDERYLLLDKMYSKAK